MTMQVTDTSTHSHSVLRGVGAIVAGFAAVVVLSTATDAFFHGLGVFPQLGQPMSAGLYVLALAYRTLFTVAGGYIAARLAPRRPLAHAVALGVIGIVAGTAGAVAMWQMGDQWYPIALVLLALPSTWLGGWLFSRRH
jgi:hypothetical protein